MVAVVAAAVCEEWDSGNQSSGTYVVSLSSYHFSRLFLLLHMFSSNTLYLSLIYIPPGFTFYLAHEFFDALPVHVFKVTSYLC